MGTLFIVATPIGNLGDMTPRAIEVLRSVQVIAAEDTRHSGGLLHHFEIDTRMVSYHHHNRQSRAEQLLGALDHGDVALISDAGTPGIADPGHELVDDALRAGHTVVPVPGASSMVAAVSASGLVPGPFLFVGFLPRSGAERRVALGKAVGSGFPFVIFESPLRTVATLTDLAAATANRSAVVARELTKVHEEIRRAKLTELTEWYEAQPPRGEVVIVVAGSEIEIEDETEERVESTARSILEQGIRPSKAARELSAITGIGAAEAYEVIRRVAKT